MSSAVKMTWRGAEITADGRAAAAEAIKKGLEHLLEESNRVIPHDEGVMQDSGSVDFNSSELAGTVFYDTPYAVRQHEDATLSHKNGRKHHFLEESFNDQSAALLKFIQEELEAALGG